MVDVGVGVDCFATINLNEATPTDLPSVMMVASLSSGELSSSSSSSEENMFSLFDKNKNPWDGHFPPRIDECAGSDKDHSALSDPWMIQIIIPQVRFVCLIFVFARVGVFVQNAPPPLQLFIHLFLGFIGRCDTC